MSEYRFILEPYLSIKNRYHCPACGKKSVFTRYIDLELGEYIHDTVGKCNRLQKCAYHYPPKEYFEDQKKVSGGELVSHQIERSCLKLEDFKVEQNSPPSYIENNLLQKSIKGKEDNNLLSFLNRLMNKEAINQIMETYKIGSSKKWPGATIFWQLDDKNNVRTGKIIQYDSNTGKKVRINWVHSIMKLQDFNLKQCLFGQHLLNSDLSKPIAIVESEKSAIIASIAFPEFIWMATGGLMNLKYDMLKPLTKRKVILFPDAGCYDVWNDKVKDLPKNIHFMISDLVKNKSSKKEKEEGWDIADYIIPIWLEKIKNLGGTMGDTK